MGSAEDKWGQCNFSAYAPRKCYSDPIKTYHQSPLLVASQQDAKSTPPIEWESETVLRPRWGQAS